MRPAIIKRQVTRGLNADAKKWKKEPKQILLNWRTSIEDYVKMNQDSLTFCQEIEQLLITADCDLERLSLLTSNLDCLLFERYLVKEKYVRSLFHKADAFLESKSINFLIGAIKREGFIPLSEFQNGTAIQ
jgi:signal recognition particle GTPase